MNHVEFLSRLENIAVRNKLALQINRACYGCGFFFVFNDPETGKHSNRVVYLLKEDPYELFERLEIMAREFQYELAAEKRKENI